MTTATIHLVREHVAVVPQSARPYPPDTGERVPMFIARMEILDGMLRGWWFIGAGEQLSGALAGVAGAFARDVLDRGVEL